MLRQRVTFQDIALNDELGVLECLTRTLIMATEEEVEANPRSRSAKRRLARRV